ncbi:SIMPL domain-containing protein [Ureibacillus sp. Re31]|uniref:SIMPL domain-containing protein n=1 Tax=Ureibacillus galli TaxID=2762222 RepID=A0ABR8XC35_9BACL|nr:SIMPL domain-containing protein [Ureibacillus galli]MBD8026782.1 SIMPL domain-containing protein [Ureibacillus galli]
MDHLNAYQHPSYKVRVISVIGNSQIEVKPDYAQLQIEVVTQAANITEAQTENANKMNQVIEALLALNIDRTNIQTAYFNIFPRYDYIEGKQVFRGYEVSNAIKVEVDNISEVGIVIDQAIKNGANRITGLEFKLRNEEAYYNSALQLALQNAHEKALAIASSLRLSYMPQPIEIVEESRGGPILLKHVAMTQQAFDTPIEPGTITVEATLKVIYQY